MAESIVRRPVSAHDYGYAPEALDDFWGSVFYQPSDWSETALIAEAEQNIAALGPQHEYSQEQLTAVLGDTLIAHMRQAVEHPVTRIQQRSE